MFLNSIISTIIEIFSRQIPPARSTTHSIYPTDLTAQIRSMITTLHTLSISLPISPVQTRCTPSPSALFSRFDSHVPHRFFPFFLRCRRQSSSAGTECQSAVIETCPQATAPTSLSSRRSTARRGAKPGRAVVASANLLMRRSFYATRRWVQVVVGQVNLPAGTVVVAAAIQGLNLRRGHDQAYAHIGLHVRRTLAAVTRPGKRVGWSQR